MIRSYRYRLKPNVAQKMFFIKTFGCVRYIYNWALSKRIESFQNNNDDISWKDMSSMLTSLKKRIRQVMVKRCICRMFAAIFNRLKFCIY